MDTAVQAETGSGAQMVSDLLTLEYRLDYKLSKCKRAKSANMPQHQFPFNRHTVTIGVGNAVVDFQKARQEHEDIKARQESFAEEIEKVKEEMEKVRQVEQAWYDDFRNNSYVTDIPIDIMNSQESILGRMMVSNTPSISSIGEQSISQTNGIIVTAAIANASSPESYHLNKVFMSESRSIERSMDSPVHRILAGETISNTSNAVQQSYPVHGSGTGSMGKDTLVGYNTPPCYISGRPTPGCFRPTSPSSRQHRRHGSKSGLVSPGASCDLPSNKLTRPSFIKIGSPLKPYMGVLQPTTQINGEFTSRSQQARLANSEAKPSRNERSATREFDDIKSDSDVDDFDFSMHTVAGKGQTNVAVSESAMNRAFCSVSTASGTNVDIPFTDLNDMGASTSNQFHQIIKPIHIKSNSNEDGYDVDAFSSANLYKIKSYFGAVQNLHNLNSYTEGTSVDMPTVD